MKATPEKSTLTHLQDVPFARLATSSDGPDRIGSEMGAFHKLTLALRQAGATAKDRSRLSQITSRRATELLAWIRGDSLVEDSDHLLNLDFDPNDEGVPARKQELSAIDMRYGIRMLRREHGALRFDRYEIRIIKPSGGHFITHGGELHYANLCADGLQFFHLNFQASSWIERCYRNGTPLFGLKADRSDRYLTRQLFESAGVPHGEEVFFLGTVWMSGMGYRSATITHDGNGLFRSGLTLIPQGIWPQKAWIATLVRVS